MLQFCNSAFPFRDLIEKNLVSSSEKHRTGGLLYFHLEKGSMPTSSAGKPENLG